MHIESIHLGKAEPVGTAGAFRPYTGGGEDLRTATDPINLVFVGEPDALGIRAALKGLGPGRADVWSDLVEPDSVWNDAVGGSQTAYSPQFGWSAGAVQLELGEFAGLRAHLRLFPFPEFVLGAAHLELLPPGRFEHSVFSWSGGERLVVRELERAGVVRRRTSREMRLDTPRQLEDLSIPEGLFGPAGFRQGGSTQAGPQQGNPIPGWGSLSVVTLKGLPGAETARHFRWSRLTVDSPFSLPAIAAQSEMRVQGPIDIEHEVWAERGRLRARTSVVGDLVVEVGDRTLPAHIREWQIARVHGGMGRIRSARRYLTGGLPAGLPIEFASSSLLPQRVQTRVDRKRGPQVSVTSV